MMFARTRLFLAALAVASAAAFSVSAQDNEPIQSVPIQQSAYYILGKITAHPGGVGSTTDDRTISNRLANRLIYFYTQALTYGKIPSEDFWYTPYGSLSPDYNQCIAAGGNSATCQIAFASLRDYASYYQCRDDAAAPTFIVNDHLQNNFKRLFRISGNFATGSREAIMFFRPRSGLNAITYENGQFNPQTSTVNSIRLDAYLYYAGTYNLSGLILNNPSLFALEVQKFLDAPWPTTIPTLTNPATVQPNTLYRFPRNDNLLRITSINSPIDCVWEEATGQWKMVYRSGALETNGFADGTPGFLPDPADRYDFQDGDANFSGTGNSPIDYTPQDTNWDQEGYIPPGFTSETWATSPLNPNSNNYAGCDPSEPNAECGLVDNLDNLGDFGEKEFCARDPETGECVEDESSSYEQATSFASTAANFKLALMDLFDFSALSGSGSCPSFTFSGSYPTSFSFDIPIDCDWLEIAGLAMLLMSSVLAFRIIFGD